MRIKVRELAQLLEEWEDDALVETRAAVFILQQLPEEASVDMSAVPTTRLIQIYERRLRRQPERQAIARLLHNLRSEPQAEVEIVALTHDAGAAHIWLSAVTHQVVGCAARLSDRHRDR